MSKFRVGDIVKVIPGQETFVNSNANANEADASLDKLEWIEHKPVVAKPKVVAKPIDAWTGLRKIML